MKKHMTGKMKKWLSAAAGILTAVLLLACAAAEGAEPVTADEVRALLDGIRDQAAASVPVNDPTGEDADLEDGIQFQYDFGTVYADSTEMTAETVIRSAVLTGDEEPVFRGLAIDQDVNDVLAALPSTNDEMAGTREHAVRWLEGGPEGFSWGLVLRDGQRITAVEYGEARTGENGGVRAGVLFTVQDGLVTAIRADETDIDAEVMQELYQQLALWQEDMEYKAVKTSRNGSDLTPFGEEDLVFSGMSYLTLQPEDLPGFPEDVLIDNEDGTWIRRVEGDEYEAVFTCDAEGQNAVINSLTFRSGDQDDPFDGTLEGPRCVRLGDLFHQDYARFRSENNDFDGEAEMLYGTEGTAPWGKMVFGGSDGLMLRYVTGTADGREVELSLRYTDNRLSEMILHTR